MGSNKLNILYFGNNIITLQYLYEYETVLGIFCIPDSDENNIMINNLKKFSKKHNIPIYQPLKIKDIKNIEIINKLNPDLIVVSGYKFLIPETIFSIPKKGTINIHPSYLPKYRGQHVINWAIINGENETGISIHFINEKFDAGDIIKQKKIPINIEDTAKSIFEKSSYEAVHLLQEVLEDFKRNRIVKIHQNEELATFVKPRKPEDGIIDWNNKSAFEIYNLIRGLVKPWPGAITYFEGKKICIRDSIFNTNQTKNYSVGEIINITDIGIEVATIKGTLTIKLIEYEGDIVKPEKLNIKVGRKFN